MTTIKNKNVYPSGCNPYYIITPPFERTSAGIKALHLLCHNLNLNGVPAYLIVTDNYIQNDEDLLGLDFLTPILNRTILENHFKNDRKPIFIYPEVIKGNPLNAKCVVRYVLNYPGLLGGDEIFDKNELCFAYSKELARATGISDRVLFIPTSNINIFHPPRDEVSRQGTCFYASKYKTIHNGELFETTKDSIEITRQPTDQTPEFVADLFRKSEFFYTYENTALATEATLCGCPAVFLPNPHLEGIIASDELGSDGYAWGTSKEDLERAQKTVKNAFENYQSTIQTFYRQLDDFIDETQLFSIKTVFDVDTYKAIDALISKDLRILQRQLDAEEGEPHQNYAGWLVYCPWWLELQLAEFMCTLGLTRDGDYLWLRSVDRIKKIIYEKSRINRERKKKAHALGIGKMPWWIERFLGEIFNMIGFKQDGYFLVNRSKKRCKKKRQA